MKIDYEGYYTKLYEKIQKIKEEEEDAGIDKMEVDKNEEVMEDDEEFTIANEIKASGNLVSGLFKQKISAGTNLRTVSGILVPLEIVNYNHMGIMTPEETLKYYEKKKK